jgi:diguanylate cyclase (GGDEF)-like protein
MNAQEPPDPAPSGVSDAIDERGLMGRSAGLLWLLASLVTLGGLVVPGPDDIRVGWAVGLGVYGAVYAAGSLTGVIPWARAPMWQHRLAIVVAVGPLTALVIWATGEADSYMLIVMPMAVFFTAYFYASRFTLALVALHVVALAAPLLYDSRAIQDGYPARLLGIAAGSIVLACLVLWLKRDLLEAERRQRRMALHDSLTGLANRRAFDAALDDEVARSGEIVRGRQAVPSALLFVDLDRFKAVNDTYGHPIGDRVLRDVAAACAAVVRPGDTVARIGGDEFAVVAPRAGSIGARRMALALDAAVADVATGSGDGRVSATVTHALFGEDGYTAAELMRAADRRLHAIKRTRNGAEPPAVATH